MKEKQFEEHKHLMDLIDAERERILVEKAKFETMERLKMSSSSSSTQRQSELDASIKIAQVIQLQLLTNDKIFNFFFHMRRMPQEVQIPNVKIFSSNNES